MASGTSRNSHTCPSTPNVCAPTPVSQRTAHEDEEVREEEEEKEGGSGRGGRGGGKGGEEEGDLGEGSDDAELNDDRAEPAPATSSARSVPLPGSTAPHTPVPLRSTTPLVVPRRSSTTLHTLVLVRSTAGEGRYPAE
eukprot:3934463-Rhodomonas_salina.1